MNEEQQASPPPPDENNAAAWKVMWMCAAFIPSVVGMACLQWKSKGQWPFLLVVSLDLICSLAGSIGIVRGMKNGALRMFLGFALSVFFFILNAVIVLFMGCSGTGRIAP